MEKPVKILIILDLFLILLCIISFGTKGAHWDQIQNKSSTMDAYPDIYRAMIGCIVMDVFLILVYLTVIVSFLKPNPTFKDILLRLLLLMLFIRFLVGVIFLAGEDERGRKVVNDWLTMDAKAKDKLTPEYKDFYKTFEGAYVFEIIDIILLNVLSMTFIFAWRKETGKNSTV